jgi:hypothetical protein
LLERERLASYVRLSGGFPIPLAGAVYWGMLALLGYWLDLAHWATVAFYASGAIFPLALLFARIFKNPFMTERTAVSSVLVPAFISMLLFWAIVVAAAQEGATLLPLILAIGLSLHWPVIGWSYGRTVIFSAHAIVRTLATLMIWLYYPEHRLTWLPLAVAIIYLVTVAIILIDVARLRRKVTG